MRFARGADVAAVKQQPVVGVGDILWRDMPRECLLDFERRVVALADQSESVGHAIYVGIDGKGGFPKGDALDNVGGLTAYTRQVE